MKHLKNLYLEEKVKRYIEGVYPPNTKVTAKQGIIFLDIPDLVKENLQSSTMLNNLAKDLEGVIIVENNTSIKLYTETTKDVLEKRLLDLVAKKRELDEEFKALAKSDKKVDDTEAFDLMTKLNVVARDIIKTRNELKTVNEAFSKKELEQTNVLPIWTNVEVDLEKMVKARLEEIDLALSEEGKKDILDETDAYFNNMMKHLNYRMSGGFFKESEYKYRLPNDKAITSLERSLTKFIKTKLEENKASNEVLDKKYIWLFHIVDNNDDVIAEYIDSLDEAISIALENDGKLIVANPYIDEDPSDDNAELVFADEVGAVVIYNSDEVTVSKKEIK